MPPPELVVRVTGFEQVKYRCLLREFCRHLVGRTRLGVCGVGNMSVLIKEEEFEARDR